MLYPQRWNITAASKPLILTRGPDLSQMTASRISIFTICSNNYMPMARAFIASAKTFHPEADMVICLVDERLPSRDIYDVDAETVTIDTLRIPHFKSFAFRYDVMELNTAAKPFMFLYLMEERGYETVLYFDPDIEIYAPLDAALGPLEGGASLVLTPHVLHPSEGADEPNDLGFMRAGAYNLGFLGARASAETREILHWWSRWLLFNCVNSQPTGLFVDQKFMDLVPGFGSNVAILRDPGLNVAYWNLAQRQLVRQDGRWTVEGQPLAFFHFSGFNVNEPTRLSKYTRLFNHDLEQPLAELLRAYAERVIRLGHGQLPKSSYAFGRFVSGTPIPAVVRRLFRERHPGWPSDPFTTFEAHLHRPAPTMPQTSSSIVVTNLLQYLHETTPALHRHIDLAEDDGRRALVDWFVKHAMREMQLDARLIEPVSQRFGDAVPNAPTKNGVRRAETDLLLVTHPASTDAEAIGRLVWRALQATGLPGRERAAEAGQSQEPSSEFALGRIRLSSAPEGSAGRTEADYTIAVLACDLSELPQTGWTALEQADELWAPSRYLQHQAAQRFSKPTLYMPLAHQAAPNSDRLRSDFALPPRRFLFVQALDGSCSIERGNVIGTIKAFRRAFPAHRPTSPGLVICRSGAQKTPDLSQELQALGLEDDGIFLVDQELAQHDLAALIALCDAAISLHRLEGVGLFVANAMLLGRPVIATDYSATTEFVTPETGFPVDCHLTRSVRAPSHPEQQGLQAEPDLDQAAWLMRRLVDHPNDAAPYVARGYEHLARNYSLKQVVDRQLSRLREINFNV